MTLGGYGFVDWTPVCYFKEPFTLFLGEVTLEENSLGDLIELSFFCDTLITVGGMDFFVL